MQRVWKAEGGGAVVGVCCQPGYLLHKMRSKSRRRTFGSAFKDFQVQLHTKPLLMSQAHNPPSMTYPRNFQKLVIFKTACSVTSHASYLLRLTYSMHATLLEQAYHKRSLVLIDVCSGNLEYQHLLKTFCINWIYTQGNAPLPEVWPGRGLFIRWTVWHVLLIYPFWYGPFKYTHLALVSSNSTSLLLDLNKPDYLR